LLLFLFLTIQHHQIELVCIHLNLRLHLLILLCPTLRYSQSVFRDNFLHLKHMNFILWRYFTICPAILQLFLKLYLSFYVFLNFNSFFFFFIFFHYFMNFVLVDWFVRLVSWIWTISIQLWCWFFTWMSFVSRFIIRLKILFNRSRDLAVSHYMARFSLTLTHITLSNLRRRHYIAIIDQSAIYRLIELYYSLWILA